MMTTYIQGDVSMLLVVLYEGDIRHDVTLSYHHQKHTHINRMYVAMFT